MKNIHTLPTDKPSRLYYWEDKLVLGNLATTPMNRNIYITNDEEIKDGDWFLTDDKRVEKCAPDWRAREWHKKIILTTDQDLIIDGVQSIDDEFLEWFVKNPSCEEVKVEKVIWNGVNDFEYRIIIPQEEEPKQVKERGITITHVGKKETLVEAALIYASKPRRFGTRMTFIDGAKWQQEQILDFLYSEITERRDYSASKMCEVVIEFIEQFKNK